MIMTLRLMERVTRRRMNQSIRDRPKLGARISSNDGDTDDGIENKNDKYEEEKQSIRDGEGPNYSFRMRLSGKLSIKPGKSPMEAMVPV